MEISAGKYGANMGNGEEKMGGGKMDACKVFGIDR